MKSSLVILLIGAIVAVACAAPSRKVSMQEDDDGDKLAKTARWFGIAKRVINGLNTAVNGEKLALNQDDEDDDDGDDLLSQALLERIQEQVALEQEATAEEDEDDDDDGDKAAAQFHLHFHIG